MDQLEAQYKEQQIIAKLKLEHAQALHHAQQAKGENQYAPTEPFKLRKDYNDAVKKYGKDSEEAKYYKQAMENHIYSHGEGRFAPSPTTKVDQELARAREKDPNSPETKNLELAANKLRSDESIRNRAVQATQLEQSMDAIDIQAITRYSGPEGALALKRDQVLDLMGQAPVEYKKYQESVVAAKMEAKQLRQMLGESVREKLATELEALTNPASIGKSPETAALMLEKYRDIIRRELRTIQKAQTSTEPYLGKEGKEEAIKKVESEQSSKSTDDPLGLF
jgi:hypothetical protein